MIRFIIRRRYGNPQYPWDVIRLDDAAISVVEESQGFHATVEQAIAAVPADVPLAVELQLR